MSLNNANAVTAISARVDGVQVRFRTRVSSEPCLPERLPNSGCLQREAEVLVSQELTKELLLKSSMEEMLDVEPVPEPEGVHKVQLETQSPPRSPSHIGSYVKSILSPLMTLPPSSTRSNVQPFEVMKAVEDRDLIFLMQVRDKAFTLLLQSSGGETPLVHAIRIGHKDVAIVLLGAFSRWINHLEDEDIQKPQTQTLLKALRVGLKLAINEGLAKSQSDLIASFMQTLIMSEGDKWVYAQVSTVARALNSGCEGKPVQVASEAVRKFTTKELGKAALIASLEDYVANATADLLLIAAWSNVLQIVNGHQIPSSYFARDDRVYKVFLDRIDRKKAEIQQKCGRQLRWQLSILKDGLEGRSITFRRKIELLAKHLDEGEGVPL